MEENKKLDDEVELFALQVVTNDPILNSILCKTIEDYPGFKGVHIMGEQEEFPVLILFDSIKNRNDAYMKINGVDKDNPKKDQYIVVSIVMQSLYVKKDSLK